MVEILRNDRPPSVVLLSAEAGIDPTDFCDAGRHQAGEEACETVVWHLDLDAFDPDGNDPLGDYLRVLLEEKQRHQEAARSAATESEPAAKALANTELRGPATDWAAALISLLWQFEDPLERFIEALYEPATAGDPAIRDDPETLRSALEQLTVHRKLLIHVENASHLTTSLRRWLIREAERAPHRLLLAISCGLPDETAAVASGASPPPERIELRRDRAVSATVSRSLFEEVDERIEGELSEVLHDFLLLAALCGRYVSVGPLLVFLELDRETGDAVIDFLDDELVDELGWLADLGFHHPAFPGHNVYAFTHPLLPRIILDRAPEGEQAMRAVTLLRFLEQRVPVARRGIARLFLNLACHLSERDRRPYELQLAWWVGRDRVEELKAQITEAIERGDLEPEMVWRIAQNPADGTPLRCLALLDAYARAMMGDNPASSTLTFDRQAALSLPPGPTASSLRSLPGSSRGASKSSTVGRERSVQALDRPQRTWPDPPSSGPGERRPGGLPEDLALR